MKSKRARQESTSDDSEASEDSVLSVDNSSESEDSESSSEDLKRSKKKKKRAASSESDSDSETHHKRSAKKRKHKKKKKKHSKKKRRHGSHEESDVEITSASDGEVYIRKKHKHKHKHSSKGPKKSRDSSTKDSEKYEYKDDGKEQRYYSTVQSVIKDKHVSSVENITSDEERELKSHRSHASEKYFSKDYNHRREEAKPRDIGPSRGRRQDEDGDRRVEELHRFYRGSSKDRTRSADGRDREREPYPYDRNQHKKFDAEKPGIRYAKESYEQKYSERYQGGYQGQGFQKSRHQDYGEVEPRSYPDKEDNSRYQQSRPDRYDNSRPTIDTDVQRHRPRYEDDYRGKDRGYNSRYNANSGPSDSRFDPKPSGHQRDYQNRQYQSNQSSIRNDRDYYNKGQKEDIRSIPRLDSIKLDRFEPRIQEETRTERPSREPERPKRRSPAYSKSSKGEGKSRSPNGHREKRRRRSEEGDKDYEWGKTKEVEVKKEPVEKEKPNFGLSGKLTQDTNMVNGVVLKYSEPDDAKQPKRKWRFYPFKGDKALPILYIHRQSYFLLGRDRAAADIPLEHPSVSKQHAALQYRAVAFTRDDGSVGRRIRPYIIDLDSANGTFVNNKKIEPRKYVELLERDVVKFGFSQRDYVLLHENSKDDAMDDDCQQNEVGVKVESVKSEKV